MVVIVAHSPQWPKTKRFWRRSWTADIAERMRASLEPGPWDILLWSEDERNAARFEEHEAASILLAASPWNPNIRVTTRGVD